MIETSPVILSLRGFGVAFADRVVLSAVDLEVPWHGITVLMGPVGAGKSTLLRTIAGINDAAPSLRTWGEAWYGEEPLRGAEAPALVAQHVKLLMASVRENILNDLPERTALTGHQKSDLAQRLLRHAGLDALADDLDQPVVDLPLAVQRHLAVARTAAANPRLICVDEPTASLDSEGCTPLLRYLRELGTKRAVLVVVHNQLHARALGGQTALLAGGVIQACAPTAQFFEQPATEVAASFVRSGSCSLPSPNATPEDLDSGVPEPAPLPAEASRSYVSDALGPRGFLWLEKGSLAGTPRPGVVLDVEHDLKALQRVGVTVLVSLTSARFDPELLQPYGIQGLWFPITDMCAPDPEAAKRVCRQVRDLMGTGHVVAYHCKAGLGRTGTMLAAQLIWGGKTALDALETVRRIEPRWVQSEEQVSFLEAFSKAVITSEQGQSADYHNNEGVPPCP